ncbi:MAG: YraN family protein [Patescibacteria group bacterium]|nr:YraN family protein [Patescibacteria group bacterium]
MKVSSQTGSSGEELAVKFLKSQGYKILDRNFSKRYGEIDIIALDADTLVFIEVKTRRPSQFGNPFEGITHRKMESVIKTAHYYTISHKNLPQSMRIDAVGIRLDDFGGVENIRLIKNISGF